MNDAELREHLAGGTTTLCRLWMVTRRDGVVLGFTDHDLDLEVDGVVFRAGSGLSASALAQATGLSVDNTEAAGALSDAAISEADLAAGRYDGAEVRIWLANWADPQARRELFRGSFGEVARRGAEFRVELRGLAEPLNQPMGRVYARTCSAVLGDARCRLDMNRPEYAAECAVLAVADDGRVLELALGSGFAARWFEGGRVEVLSGAAAGLSGMVKSDPGGEGVRRVELWQSLRAPVGAGDLLRIGAGCDKRAVTCREKFGNFLNFRGFPHMPGEDWITAYPRDDQPMGGGSLMTP